MYEIEKVMLHQDSIYVAKKKLNYPSRIVYEMCFGQIRVVELYALRKDCQQNHQTSQQTGQQMSYVGIRTPEVQGCFSTFTSQDGSDYCRTYKQ